MMGIEWTVIGTGIALAMLTIALFAWLRTDVKTHVGELREEMRTHIQRLEAGQGELREEMKTHVQRLEVGQGELRERMARLEGLIDGLREAITGRRAA